MNLGDINEKLYICNINAKCNINVIRYYMQCVISESDARMVFLGGHPAKY